MLSEMESQKGSFLQQQMLIPSLERLGDQSSSIIPKSKEDIYSKQFNSPKAQKKLQINLPSNQELQLNDFRNFLREQIFIQQSKQVQTQSNIKCLTDFFSSKQFKLHKNQKTLQQNQKSLGVSLKNIFKSMKQSKQNLSNQIINSERNKQRSFTNNFTQTNYNNTNQSNQNLDSETDQKYNNTIKVEAKYGQEVNQKIQSLDQPKKQVNNWNKFLENQNKSQRANLLSNLKEIKNENIIQKFNKKNSVSLNCNQIFANEQFKQKIISPSQSVQKNSDIQLKNASCQISQMLQKQKQDNQKLKYQSFQEDANKINNFKESQSKTTIQDQQNEIKVKNFINFAKNKFNYNLKNEKYKQEPIILPTSVFNSPKIKKNISSNKSDELDIKPWDYYNVHENIFDSYNNLVEINQYDIQIDDGFEPS